jgi:hypothetical protein
MYKLIKKEMFADQIGFLFLLFRTHLFASGDVCKIPSRLNPHCSKQMCVDTNYCTYVSHVEEMQ